MLLYDITEKLQVNFTAPTLSANSGHYINLKRNETTFGLFFWYYLMCIQDISNKQQCSKATLPLKPVTFQIFTSTVNVCSYVSEKQKFHFFRKPERRLFLKNVANQGQGLPYEILERDINFREGSLILLLNLRHLGGTWGGVEIYLLLQLSRVEQLEQTMLD